MALWGADNSAKSWEVNFWGRHWRERRGAPASEPPGAPSAPEGAVVNLVGDVPAACAQTQGFYKQKKGLSGEMAA